MKFLLKKYVILLLATIITARILTALIMFIWPHLLTFQMPHSQITYSNDYLEYGIEILINIVLVFIILKEMKKEKVVSVPILIITFFQNYVGILIFLLVLTHRKLLLKQSK